MGATAGFSLAVGDRKSDGHASTDAAAIPQLRVRGGPGVAVGGLAQVGVGELPISPRSGRCNCCRAERRRQLSITQPDGLI